MWRICVCLLSMLTLHPTFCSAVRPFIGRATKYTFVSISVYEGLAFLFRTGYYNLKKRKPSPCFIMPYI